uniref:Transferase family protein n=1 Tax=Rhizophora mucronata TaxID=61149 RepID=A0A2P2L8L2_RHIMU
MVPGDDQNLIYNIKLSSVVPCRITGSDVVSEPNGVDLAMKLHYLKGVYFFGSQESQDMTITRIKESMFHWLNDYYMVCGRFRRSDTGRPYIKCNDCGVRVVEAQCDKTVDEWLELKDRSLDHLLVYHLPIGPELTLSPPLYVQVTFFTMLLRIF